LKVTKLVLKLQHLQKLAIEAINQEVVDMAVINQEVDLSAVDLEVEALEAVLEVVDMVVINQEAVENEVVVMVAEALEVADSPEAEAAVRMLEKEQVKDFQVQS
jgi:hypothetical protein